MQDGGTDPECWLHVLVPAYGDSPYLGETLASVLAAADDSLAVTVVRDRRSPTTMQRAVEVAGPAVEYIQGCRRTAVSRAPSRPAPSAAAGRTR